MNAVILTTLIYININYPELKQRTIQKNENFNEQNELGH